MAWTQFMGELKSATDTEEGRKAFPGAVPWHDETNKKDWYNTPFQNLLAKLREVEEGKVKVETSESGGLVTIWIGCSDENDIWVSIASNGFIEMGVPGA